MSFTYDNLWVLLSQKGLKRIDLCEKAGITTNVLAKLGKNQSVQVEVLSKICGALECSFDDIISNTGENSIISPLPKIDFEDFAFWEVRDEFETLGIKILKDFPKPYTVNNITKYLVRCIKECKLSIKAVNVFLEELRKHNISITIDENVVPEYERIPKNFSNKDDDNEFYPIEYQQVNNYLNWFLEKEDTKTRVKEIIENIGVPYLDETEETDISKVVYEFEDDDTIRYIAPIEKVNNDYQYPFNLLFDIFGAYGTYGYSFLYQHNEICKRMEEAIKSLTSIEEVVVRCFYIESMSINEIYKSLELPDNNTVKELFENRFLKRSLRKLRHPSRSKHIKDFTHNKFDTKIKLSELKWCWWDSYVEIDLIKRISKFVEVDYILGVFKSEKTCLNNNLFIIEALHKGELQMHLFVLDVFGNIFKVREIASSEKIIKHITDEFNNNCALSQKPHNREISLDELDLSIRSYQCLRRAKIYTLDNIVEKTEDDLVRVRNLGKKCLEEILQKVQEYGYYLNNEGAFVYRGLDDSHPISEIGFAKYYIRLYSRNRIEDEQLLIDNFFERCTSLGYTLDGADWFVEMFFDTTHSLNDINVIDKINNSKLLGSVILKKWRHITHWSSESLLSRENRIWFIVALNRLYQIGLKEAKEKQ